MRCWSAVSRLVASTVLIAYSLLMQFVAASGLRQPTHINRVFRRDRGVVDAPSFNAFPFRHYCNRVSSDS